MKKNQALVIATAFILALFSFFKPTSAQELLPERVEVLSAKVIEIHDEREENIWGTETTTTVQDITVEIKETGEEIRFINDYFVVREGDNIFIRSVTDQTNKSTRYAVYGKNRIWPIIFLLAVFVASILFFAGKQGFRSLISLVGSLYIIFYLFVPQILGGAPPVLTSIVFAVIILAAALFLTHGFNRRSTIAFVGTVTTVILTGLLSWAVVQWSGLTGFASDEATYLNFNTGGSLNLQGILLGGIIIGMLGVLDDIAVTQVAVVRELFGADARATRKKVYQSAIRIGREHVTALVNTLVLAYVGVSLPLLLYVSSAQTNLFLLINQEVFVTEIIRTLAGSIGLILTVPLTTLIAVLWLYEERGIPDTDPEHVCAHHHGHNH